MSKKKYKKNSKLDSDISAISLSSQSVTSKAYPLFTKNQANNIINYGFDNSFPQNIIDLNNKSAINKAIIENKVTYICGNGVNDIKYKGMPNPKETWDDFIEKIAKDYTTFGGFCFQVILNKDGKSISLFHTDFSVVRISETNDYGTPLSYKMSGNWAKASQYKPTEIDAYGIEDDVVGKPTLYYYRDYAPGLEYYPIPSYYSALNFVEADGLLGEFYRNSINNGFMPSAIITIPSNQPDEAKSKFDRDLSTNFSGTNGACKILVMYGESSDIKPEITAFNSSNNADVYNNVNDAVFQKIISAHGLTSPTLAGLSGSGNLSSNANEIINSFVLYNSTVIRKLRRSILDVLNVFVTNNGYDNLEIKDLDIVSQIKIDDRKVEPARESSDNKNIQDITNNENSDKSYSVASSKADVLAVDLGVGGTQSLMEVINGTMTLGQKRNILRILFNFTDRDIDDLLPAKIDTNNKAL